MAMGVGPVGQGQPPLPAARARPRAPPPPVGRGASQSPPAFFNVAFRTHEPMTDLHELDSVPAAAQSPSWWRDADQGQALASGDISSLSASVDFAKLGRRATDNSAVPRTGPMDRIMASHFEPSQGVARRLLVDLRLRRLRLRLPGPASAVRDLRPDEARRPPAATG